MAYFVKHEACSHCGSRDNLARYSDGSAHCFGCKYNERPTGYTYAAPIAKKAVDPDSIHGFLNGLTSDFSEECVGWLGKYEIDGPTALLEGFKWHPYREQLVFLWADGEQVIAYQARNFSKTSTRKYFTQGDIEALMPVYCNRREGRSQSLVLVEDVISAVKCSRYTDSLSDRITLQLTQRILILLTPDLITKNPADLRWGCVKTFCNFFRSYI